MYCRKHAEEIDRNTAHGRSLSTNWSILGDERGALDEEVIGAIETLRNAALAMFRDGGTSPYNQAADDPARLVEDRLALRYRRDPPSQDTTPGWSVAQDGEGGRPAISIIQRALRGLAGIDEDDEFLIPGHPQAIGAPLERFANAHGAIQALLGDDQVQALLAERGLASPDWLAYRQSLERVQIHLAAAISEMEESRLGRRPPKTASDAAIVLLAGCWWLATGVWPKPSNRDKGRFFAWAGDVLRAMRSDLAAEVTKQSAMSNALARRRGLTEGKDGFQVCCGPWLAYLVTDKLGAP